MYEERRQGLLPLPTEQQSAGSERHELAQECINNLEFEPLGKLGVFLKNAFHYNQYQEVLTEREFEIPYGLYTLRGRPDFLGKHAHGVDIFDWKGWPGYEHAEQLYLYGLEARRLWPETSHYRGQFFFTQGGFPSAPIHFTNDDLDRFEEELGKKIDDLNACRLADNFPCEPDYHCKSCPFAAACEISQKYEVKQIVTGEDAARLAQVTLVQEAVVKQNKDVIKDWMLANQVSEIAIGKGRYYLSPTITLRSGKAKIEKKIGGEE